MRTRLAALALLAALLAGGCGSSTAGPEAPASAGRPAAGPAQPEDADADADADGGGDPDAGVPRDRKPTGVDGVQPGEFHGSALHGGVFTATVTRTRIQRLSVSACGGHWTLHRPASINGTHFTAVVAKTVISGVFTQRDHLQGAVQVPASCSTTFDATR